MPREIGLAALAAWVTLAFLAAGIVPPDLGGG
jgi:hypothetical protein